MRFVSLRRRPAVELLAWVVLAQLAGAVGSIFTTTSLDPWYATLARPWFAPPNWVFGPVWVTLFTLMGVAAFLVSRSDHPRSRRALVVFGGHLVVNVAWSAAFFGLQSPALGLVVIVVLLAAIAVTMREFALVDRRAAALLAPYLLWTAFATVLNYGFWSLN
ncbi:tryptophan-rich sensory protein [Haloferax mediterranei ATCC 33500]|uniref:Tryptophan-rich sensory protein n=1 Tax=Haloferax mediterranei (strain ATCC 33500 / DSM 1411 / JCM 8866 / NBRC 14739 / NCIMB 2177 / R-4) TaxID=523841 RepID=I3R138_HALMT|nr:TspO/MBR family protein [Haloferax mediterranei]AFK17948.1 tryptophan-rich sensory protein [Haloferax mediterranei ATCC 33500]AHZ22630.1 TspO and MBR [Haloferax mediterranei ATCC 33500]EMA02774.1 tryptophan-rich sensory protein [Haloferax mediterranei ATCC 33500]MDX5988041.1 TspO/MBR family protein [Haloferax mediterranei ATCC 33500]QCQ74501.1 tryptophan-rich sensory protein [Haloferax mediterranei ATCC 33500]